MYELCTYIYLIWMYIIYTSTTNIYTCKLMLNGEIYIKTMNSVYAFHNVVKDFWKTSPWFHAFIRFCKSLWASDHLLTLRQLRSHLPKKRKGSCIYFKSCIKVVIEGDTLQGINISHLGKRKIIFKMPFLGDMLVPWRAVMWFQFMTLVQSIWRLLGGQSWWFTPPILDSPLISLRYGNPDLHQLTSVAGGSLY